MRVNPKALTLTLAIIFIEIVTTFITWVATFIPLVVTPKDKEAYLPTVPI